jgi:DNA polymerase-3 subunit chi
MPKIDFYVLPDADPLARFRYACRIAEKAFSLGHRVHIHTGSRESAQQLDALLWTFRDRAFVPHEIEPAKATDCPVTIGNDWIPQRCEVLINLAPEAPAFFSRFERVADIVSQAEDARNAGRLRYRYYREQGCAPSHHDVSG